MREKRAMNDTPYVPGEPIAAVATALYPAALGIVRVSGTGCLELLGRLFSRPRTLMSAAGNTVLYGWITDPSKPEPGNRIDETMIAVYRAPKSFTGEDMAEIMCHGGTAVVLAVYRLLIRSGFRPAQKGEFTLRAFVNGKTDLTKAEAVREIAEAKTEESSLRAAMRLSGKLHEELENIKQQIVRVLAAIEVEIEYPEDEETSAGAFDAEAAAAVCGRLEELETGWDTEKLYLDGARVVLCGRTNAGKSSLFNKLLNEDRAIVSDVRGTTRDWLESWTSFGGLPVRLFDTAGLRETEDTIERAGLERTRALADKADLILYIIDAAEGVTAEDREFLSAYGKNTGGQTAPVLLVWNKSDKVPELPGGEQTGTYAAGQIRASAKTGEGIPGICAAAKKLLLGSAETGRDGQVKLGSERQKAAVAEALESLRHAVRAAEEGYPMDAVAQDLQDAVTSIGEITGEVTSADILNEVFSGFCVGK